MRSTRTRILAPASAIALAAAMLTAAGPGSAQPEGSSRPPDVAVRLNTDRTSFPTAEPIVVRVTISNRGSRPVEILRWFTPMDGLERSLFAIRRDGEPVPYRGKLVKRAAPTQADYLTIQAGGQVGAEVELSAAYDLSRPGTYQITYDVGSIQLYASRADEPQNESRLLSAPLQIVVGG